AEVRDDLLDRLAVERPTGEGVVRLVDIRLVVLVVVQRHRLRIDVRLERVVVVGKGRHLVGHRFSSRTSSGRDLSSNSTKAQDLTSGGYCWALDARLTALLSHGTSTARRRGGDLAQAHGPRGPRPAARIRSVDVAAGRLAGAPERRPDRPRGDGRHRLP